MSYSVVIPTKNEAANITKIIQACQTQSFPPQQIIIVDGQSTDHTRDLINSRDIILHTIPPNTANQRNAGAALVESEYICFLDADVIPGKYFASRCLTEIRQHHLVIACPRFVPDTQRLIPRLTFAFLNTAFRLTSRFLPSGAGMCIWVERSVFAQSPGFDPTQTYEDIEFIRRLGTNHRYGVLSVPLTVSTRRFRKEGDIRLSLKYLILGILFFFGRFNLSNRISYPRR